METITEKEALRRAHEAANSLVRDLKADNDAFLKENPDCDLEPDYEQAHKDFVQTTLEIIGRHLVIVPTK